MTGHRVARLNEQLRRELTELIQEEVRDPRASGAIIMGVDVTSDLSYARVYVTAPGDETARHHVLEGLQAAASFLRGELSRRLHIRRSPELRFELDRSLDRARRIEDLLQEALPPGSHGEAEDDGSAGS